MCLFIRKLVAKVLKFFETDAVTYGKRNFFGDISCRLALKGRTSRQIEIDPKLSG